jgi:hypothetical protein
MDYKRDIIKIWDWLDDIFDICREPNNNNQSLYLILNKCIDVFSILCKYKQKCKCINNTLFCCSKIRKMYMLYTIFQMCLILEPMNIDDNEIYTMQRQRESVFSSNDIQSIKNEIISQYPSPFSQ